MEITAKELIEKLNLHPHPEGGFFRETYRSAGQINIDDPSSKFKGNRSFSTCIYFLLTPETFSAFHKIHQDEIWHFYLGASIHLHTISPKGIYTLSIIGNDLGKNATPQCVVPGNHWFAAEVIQPNGFALVGCTVAPGFDFADFTLAERDTLAQKFPQHREMITRLTRT